MNIHLILLENNTYINTKMNISLESSRVSYRVIQNNLEKSTIKEIVERHRKKGGLFHRRIIEKLAYLKPVLWPVRQFEISYTKDNALIDDSTKTRTQSNFMLGKFSLPFAQKLLLHAGGRKALSLIFSKENKGLLQLIGDYTTSVPAIQFLDPSVVYTSLYEVYIQHHDKLVLDLEKIKEEVQPILTEADTLQQKAEIAQKNSDMYSSHKSAPEYKEYRTQASDFKNQARKLRKEANGKIATQNSIVEKFKRQWFLGKRNALKIKKDFKITKFENIDTFYHLFWIARFDSKSGIRHLIINEKGRQEKDLQEMLLVDSQFRAEIDNIFNFKETKKGLVCYYCGELISKTQKICSSCKKDILKCSVCKLPISQNQEIGQCPRCESQAHLTHLFEWIKTQGKCPVCLQKITIDSIEDLQK